MKTTSMIRFASFVTLASASLALVGCGDNAQDGGGTVTSGSGGSGTSGGSSNPAAIPYPASCADVAQGEPLPDGDQVLYVGNDPMKMWTAFCHDGDEYLTLAANPDANFGLYQAGGDALGTSVKTRYQRLRIDPATLALDIDDQTFATSTGDIAHSGDPDATSMPYGVAMACGGDSVFAYTEIDVTGTPFSVVANFATGGGSAGGSATVQTSQTLFISGNGACGWEAPAGMPAGEPINPRGPAYVLQLTYGTH